MYAHTRTHSLSLTHTHTNTNTHTHTQIHTHKHTHTHARPHAHTPTHTHALSLSHTHVIVVSPCIQMHAHIVNYAVHAREKKCARMRACKHYPQAYIHTHTHARTYKYQSIQIYPLLLHVKSHQITDASLDAPCHTGWRRSIGALSCRSFSPNRPTNYRALSRKMTYKDKASYGSSPFCTIVALEQFIRDVVQAIAIGLTVNLILQS